MKQLLKLIGTIILSIIISCGSFFIKNGTDNSDIETIGLITKWGLPISFAHSAPGLAWTQFNGVRFWFNVLFWFIGILLFLFLISKTKKHES